MKNDKVGKKKNSQNLRFHRSGLVGEDCQEYLYWNLETNQRFPATRGWFNGEKQETVLSELKR